MPGLIARAIWAAVLGAAAGAALFLLAYGRHPALAFEMDRDLPPRVLSGLYGVEHAGQETFAWTSDRTQLTIQGLDRSVRWSCIVRARSGRPPGAPPATMTVAVDGDLLATTRAPDEYSDVAVTAPTRATRGLRLTIAATPTFVPSPSDPRPLGVQLDRIACTPLGGAASPPRAAIVDAGVAGAAFGAMFALLGASAIWTAAATLAIAAIQAFALSIDLAPFTLYSDQVMWMAIWIASLAVLGSRVLGFRTEPQNLTFPLAFTASALFVKLLALLHPAKAVIDALFHAHRLEYMLGGRYFFTQAMPGGVQFPYAIALYVVAAPWAVLTRDHIGLLRIVVCSAEAVAGLMLFWAMARVWRDRAAAVCALILYHVLPVSYWIAFNANLTNGFGQSAALAAMSALIAWRLASRDWIQVAGLALLSALAFLSHVSTFALLGATMALTVVISRWRGGRAETAAARSIAIAMAIAIALAVGLYYGRPEFYPAYKSAATARSETVTATPTPTPTSGELAPPANGRLAEGAIETMSLPARVLAAGQLALDGLGWPMLVLAGIGLWRVTADSGRNRLNWAIGAWLASTVTFLAFGIVAPGGVGHQRQALEFIARAVYAGSPAVLILAGRGAAWAWSRSVPFRLGAAALIGRAIVNAASQWAGWIR